MLKISPIKLSQMITIYLVVQQKHLLHIQKALDESYRECLWALENKREIFPALMDTARGRTS